VLIVASKTQTTIVAYHTLEGNGLKLLMIGLGFLSSVDEPLVTHAAIQTTKTTIKILTHQRARV
jgi:hypothetical protein